MLRDLQLRNFRCFESIAVEFESGLNFIVGVNGRGKTTLLEAACVLLRLQSQRTPNLTPAVRAGRSRNALLKSAAPRPRELEAYAEPLVRAGTLLREMRATLVRRLAPSAEASHRAISGDQETLLLEYAPGSEEDFAAHLERT